MLQSDQISVNIPKQFIDNLANAIAAKVSARVEGRLNSDVLTVASRSILEADRVRPTFLRLKEVSERVGLARSTIYSKIGKGRFPQPVNLGGRSVAWRVADIEAWESNPSAYGID